MGKSALLKNRRCERKRCARCGSMNRNSLTASDQVLMTLFQCSSAILLAVSLLTSPGLCGEKPSPRIQRFLLSKDAGLSQAVRVSGARLIHTTQLLPRSGTDTSSQFTDLMKQLTAIQNTFHTTARDVVKLNIYLARASDRDAVAKSVATSSAGELPAVCYVATPLPNGAKCALDAVFAAGEDGGKFRLQTFSRPGSRALLAKELPRGDVVYVSGQAEAGDLATATRGTLSGLLRTLKAMNLDRANIVQIKCFLQPMSQRDVAHRELVKFVEEQPLPPVSYVEWIAGSRPIEIELIASAPETKSDNPVSYFTPPWMKSSPVFSRVARIHGDDRIYISGLSAGESNLTGEAEVRSVFGSLEKALEAAGSDLKHLAKATYYVSNDDASGALNRLRPTYYDPNRPPAASKAKVANVGIAGRHLTLDMIAAPKSN